MANCAGYWCWTEECREPGCKKCGTLTFKMRVPAGCTCPSEIAGFLIVAQREKTCPIHGQCRCGRSAPKYDDHSEQVVRGQRTLRSPFSTTAAEQMHHDNRKAERQLSERLTAEEHAMNLLEAKLDAASRPLREAALEWAREHGFGYSCSYTEGAWRIWITENVHVMVAEDGSEAVVSGHMVKFGHVTTPRGLRMLLTNWYKVHREGVGSTGSSRTP